MRNLVRTLSLSLVLTVPALALAKGGTPQNHHCVKDGGDLPGKTKKECKKEGGTWQKDATATEGSDKAKPAPAPAKEEAPKGESK